MLKAVNLMACNSEGDSSESSDTDDSDEEDQFLSLDMFEGTTALSIKCAAHTLQLAVKDFMDGLGIKDIVDRSRNVVKTLRTPTFRRTLKMLNFCTPKIDVPTRWNSTYDMLESLIKLKEVCTENLKDAPKAEEWKIIQDLVEVLKPVYDTTLNLQKQQLILSDFYKSWLTLKAVIKCKMTDMSESLISCIEKREQLLFDNDVLIAARFLDPRFRRTLSSSEKEAAKQHLKKLAAKVITLKKRNNSSKTSDNNSTTSTNFCVIDETSNQSTSSSLLRESLSQLEVLSSEEEEEEDSDNETCREMLSAYNEIEHYKPKKQDVDINLQDYWEQNKYKLPFLRHLANIINAVPATQVTVERAFSALRLILDDQRCNLSNEKLTSIMFIKLNQCNFD